MPSGNELSDRPDAPGGFEIAQLAAGLAVVAGEAAEQIRPRKVGRQLSFYRDNAIYLAIVVFCEAGLVDLAVAEHSKERDAHFRGQAGEALTAYFKLLSGTKFDEPVFASAVKRVRGRTRRTLSGGGAI